MPFLAPLIPVIAGLASAGAGVAGAVEGAQAGGRQQRALSQQEQIAAQEMKDKQQIFDLLKPFFQQYLGAGSPFLSMIQRAGAERNAQDFSNAAGQVRSTMSTSGLGFGPSGATAAAIGGLGTEAAKNASSTFLNNLLNNEQLKFTAAQGLRDLGGMAGASQNQPNVGVTLPYQSGASGLFGLSQVLQNILGKGNGGGFDYSTAGNKPNIPYPNTGPIDQPNIPLPIPGIGTSPPPVGGMGLGPF